MATPKRTIAELGLATTILLGLGAIVVVAGAVVVIAGNLSFGEYLRQLVILAAAFGLLGIGRGLAVNGNGKKPPPL